MSEQNFPPVTVPTVTVPEKTVTQDSTPQEPKLTVAQVVAAQKAKKVEPEGLTRVDFYGKPGDVYLVPPALDLKAEWEKHKKVHNFAQDKETVWPRDFIRDAVDHLGLVKSELKTSNVVSLT
jgi:hypothetical protein